MQLTLLEKFFCLPNADRFIDWLPFKVSPELLDNKKFLRLRFGIRKRGLLRIIAFAILLSVFSVSAYHFFWTEAVCCIVGTVLILADFFHRSVRQTDELCSFVADFPMLHGMVLVDCDDGGELFNSKWELTFENTENSRRIIVIWTADGFDYKVLRTGSQKSSKEAMSSSEDISFYQWKPSIIDRLLGIKYVDIPFKTGVNITRKRWRIAQLGIRASILFSALPKLISCLLLIVGTSVFLHWILGIVTAIYFLFFSISGRYISECCSLSLFVHALTEKACIVGNNGKLVRIHFPSLCLLEYRDGHKSHNGSWVDRVLLRFDNDWIEFLFKDEEGYLLVVWDRAGIRKIKRPRDSEAEEFLVGKGKTIIGKPPYKNVR